MFNFGQLKLKEANKGYFYLEFVLKNQKFIYIEKGYEMDDFEIKKYSSQGRNT